MQPVAHRLAGTAMAAALVLLSSGCGGAGSTGTAAPSTTAASSPASSTPAGPTPSAGAGSARHTPAEAAARVKALYDAYLKALGAPTASDADLQRAATPYLAPALARTVFAPDRDADYILCAQDVPSAVRLGTPRLAGGVATVVVSEVWGGTPTPASRVSVDLSTLKVTAIDCLPA